MKGVVFTTLGRMVEERFGLTAWDAVLADADPASGGAYTASASYDDAELFAIVGALAARTGTAPTDLVRAFGEYLLHEFARCYPEFFRYAPDAKTFLRTVGAAVHVEVNKLSPDAVLPKFVYRDTAPDRLEMEYRSPRRLCALAEGLIAGTAAHFRIGIETRQSRCVLRGDDHCCFDLRFHEVAHAAA